MRRTEGERERESVCAGVCECVALYDYCLTGRVNIVLSWVTNSNVSLI